MLQYILKLLKKCQSKSNLFTPSGLAHSFPNALLISMKSSLTLCIIALLPSCTPSHRSLPATEIQPWGRLKTEEVSSFTLSSNHPETDENWLLELKKNENGLWVITSKIGLPETIDPYANENLIHHLLDTLSSTRREEPAPRGPLGAFHLDPPRYAIQVTDQNKSSQLLIGDPIPNQTSSAYALIPGATTPWIISSPLLPLLRSMSSWKHLRKSTITFETPDDIDEITLLKDKKVILYAQRDGDTWTNESHQRIKPPIDSFLKKLLTTPPANLIEDSLQITQIKTFIQTHPQGIREIKLAGGLIPSFRILLFTDTQGRTLIHYTRRPDVYFQLKKDPLKGIL